MVKVGDEVTERVDSISMTLTGKVVDVDPERRCYTVEFQMGDTSIRKRTPMSLDGADIIRALRCKDGQVCCSARRGCKYQYQMESGFGSNGCDDWSIRVDAADYIESLEKEVRELREKVSPTEKKPLALFFGDSREDMVAEMNYLLNVLRCERTNTTAADRVAVLTKELAKEGGGK